MVTIGHNSTPGASTDELKSYVDRIERLAEEKAGIAEDIRSVYGEAKDKGVDVKALRAVIKRRAQDAEKLAAHEAAIDAIMHKLGLI
jgi:uncharacterized protein (UPF0335 family)